MATSVQVRAPVRVLDAGGWTDTWFAGTGVVCSVAVDDGAEVRVRRIESREARMTRMVDLRIPAFNDRYFFPLNEPPGRHPLLETALRRWAPSRCQLEVTVTLSVPPGSSLGTSACVTVALIAALQYLAGHISDPVSLAREAHDIETADLGLQSGVADQIAAAHGGINLIVIDPYPQAEIMALDMAPATWEALTRRIVTVYLGTPHRSSDIHEAVIAHIAEKDADALLAPLCAAAHHAAGALVAGNIDAYGEAMIANTEAQAALHPALVSRLARTVIDVARDHNAAGWKVNGAGGDGGTVTIIGPDDPGALIKTLKLTTGLSLIPLRPTREGVRVVAQG